MSHAMATQDALPFKNVRTVPVKQFLHLQLRRCPYLSTFGLQKSWYTASAKAPYYGLVYC